MPSLEDKAPAQQPSVARITEAQKRRMDLNDDSIYRKVISTSVSSGRVGSDSMQKLVSTFDPAIYFDINAQGTDPILSHPGLVITADGDASFAGDLSAATGTFGGTVTAGGTIAASNFTATTAFFQGVDVDTELEVRGLVRLRGTNAIQVEDGREIEFYDSGDVFRGSIHGDSGTGFLLLDFSGTVATAADFRVGDDLTVVDDTTIGGDVEIDGAINHDGSTAGFFGTAPTTKPAIVGALTGVADPNALNVIASIISALAALGLATDSTT